MSLTSKSRILWIDLRDKTSSSTQLLALNFRFLETEISEDRLLVIQEDDRPVTLDIVFRVNPTAVRVAGISLNIANVPKCEIYTGECLEYHSMAIGNLQEDMPELDVYKYELNFSKAPPAVVSLQLKPTKAEILIFGIDCFVCPSGAVSRSGGGGGIDLQHVEEMLAQSNLGISESAEKCKEFLKMSLNNDSGFEKASPAVAGFDPGVMQLFDARLRDTENRLLTEIDNKFKELEDKQENHFWMLMDKLDSISISKS